MVGWGTSEPSSPMGSTLAEIKSSIVSEIKQASVAEARISLPEGRGVPKIGLINAIGMVVLRIAVLYSGGKDSTLAALRALDAGHEIGALVSVSVRGQDSWMFHLPNIELTRVQADCMGLPWIRIEVSGQKEAEVKEMQTSLKPIIERLKIDALCTGAIASNYQMERVRRVCDALGCRDFSPLWGLSEESLLNDLLKLHFEVYFTSVSAEGLGKEWLGSRLDEQRVRDLIKMKAQYGINASGEGGEYETFVSDCPIFRKRIIISEGVLDWKRNCGTWSIKKFIVETKGLPRPKHCPP